MTPLEKLIITEIQKNGSMALNRYMELCLYHEQFGYYTTGRNFWTELPQDFTTAPEISPLFGYCLAEWMANAWNHAGKPNPFTLIEAGPGRGVLMCDMLARLQATHPACYAAVNPVLVETSPALTALQKATLAAYPKTSWYTALPATNRPTFLIANELLDAFPIRQINAQGEATTIQLTSNGALHLHQPTGPLHESSPSQNAWLETLKNQPNLIAALLIDYGYKQAEPGQSIDTLQAVHEHKKVPFTHLPGETDLTTHVDFAHVIKTLGGKTQVAGLTEFLLHQRAASIALDLKVPDTALHRLLHPSQMGALFKVLEYRPQA